MGRWTIIQRGRCTGMRKEHTWTGKSAGLLHLRTRKMKQRVNYCTLEQDTETLSNELVNIGWTTQAGESERQGWLLQWLGTKWDVGGDWYEGRDDSNLETEGTKLGSDEIGIGGRSGGEVWQTDKVWSSLNWQQRRGLIASTISFTLFDSLAKYSNFWFWMYPKSWKFVKCMCKDTTEVTICTLWIPSQQ